MGALMMNNIDDDEKNQESEKKQQEYPILAFSHVLFPFHHQYHSLSLMIIVRSSIIHSYVFTTILHTL
jgi:hypothetical protein